MNLVTKKNLAALNEKHKQRLINFEQDKEEKDFPKGTFDKEYADVYASVGVFAFCIFLQEHAKNHIKAMNAFTQFLSDTNCKDLPYISISGSSKDIRVYPNVVIPFEHQGQETHKKISVFVYPEIYEQQFITIKKEQAHKEKSKKWETLKAATKTLESNTQMPVGKLLTTLLPKKKSHEIRDLADKISSELSPNVFKILSSPQDIAEAYEQGPPSCMSSKSSSADSWKAQWTKEKIHPVMLYGYNPDTALAVLMKGKIVKARAFCVIKNKVLKLGRVYTSGGSHITQTLKNEIEEAGYTLKAMSEAHETTQDYEVPGLWSALRRDYLLPTPYSDNLKGGAGVYFNIARKCFVITPKKKTDAVLSLAGTNGFITAKSILSTLRCSVCGDKIKESTRTAENGTIFCSVSCLKSAGYIHALDKDGVFHIRPQQECIIDAMPGADTWYTTEYVLKKLNAVLYMSMLGVIPNSSQLTTHTAYTCLYKDVNYAISGFLYKQLKNKTGKWQYRGRTREIIPNNPPKQLRLSW